MSENETSESLSVEEARDLIVKEFGNRLRDPAERKRIPATSLASVLGTLARMEERDQDLDKPDTDQAEMSILDMVRSIQLPAERKRELLDRERERVAGYLAEIDAELEGEPG